MADKTQSRILITVTLPPQQSLPHTILLSLGWQKNTQSCILITVTIPPQHSLRGPLQLLLGWQKKHRAVYYSNNSYTTTPTFPQRPFPASTQLTKKHRAVYYSNNSYTPTPTFPQRPSPASTPLSFESAHKIKPFVIHKNAQEFWRTFDGWYIHGRRVV